MNAVVMKQRPKSIVEAPEVAQAMRHAEKALALLRSGCPRLARLELAKADRALEEAQDAPQRCMGCGGVGFDEDGACGFCEGTGRQEAL